MLPLTSILSTALLLTSATAFAVPAPPPPPPTNYNSSSPARPHTSIITKVNLTTIPIHMKGNYQRGVYDIGHGLHFTANRQTTVDFTTYATKLTTVTSTSTDAAVNTPMSPKANH
ncbi:hypothetical protein UCRPC4_g00262 [Phaeomoniella chlamydospora]|uniref:Uncharacterized protein n=1 Tax=Phaeomoniella chlamydospora TaxID=158046 RepID=A0A0G2H162_PHACM|nr:hypothetical protein UCRPC4_g00262 [Phaeomoniella chlamydospora]